MKRTALLLMIFCGMQSWQSLSAQNKEAEVSQLVNRIIGERKSSNDLLSKYCWTSRTEILKSKEVLNIMIEKNQYGPDGKVIQKVINEQGAKMPKTFIIHQIAEEEKENMEKFLFGLRDYLKKYTLPDVNQVKKFIEAATWQVIDSTHEFIFTGRNVEDEGDELTWWVEDLFYSTAKIEVQTIFQKEIVYFTGTFMRLKDGLNYMAYAEAYIPAKKITLQLHNYDYMQE